MAKSINQNEVSSSENLFKYMGFNDADNQTFEIRITTFKAKMTCIQLEVVLAMSLTHRAREKPYGAHNSLPHILDIPTWHLCIVALNPRYFHIGFRLLQQKTIICSLIGRFLKANNSLVVYLSFDV